MPSTLVHAGLALVLAAALLGDAYDRKALALVLVILVLPEADTLAGPVLDGAHRALLHTLVIPAAATVLLVYDTRVRERSLLAHRYGDWGVRVAWVLLFVHVFAHVLLDYAHLEGINLVYPLYDRFFQLEGELALSTTEGIVQTFVEIDLGEDGTAVDAGSVGTTADTHINNPVEPSDDPPEDPERIFPFTWHGWQLSLLLVGLFTVLARRLQGPEPTEEP